MQNSIPVALLAASLSHSSQKEKKNLFDRVKLLSLAFIYHVEILDKYVL